MFKYIILKNLILLFLDKLRLVFTIIERKWRIKRLINGILIIITIITAIIKIILIIITLIIKINLIIILIRIIIITIILLTYDK
jgi:hypothetical protein